MKRLIVRQALVTLALFLPVCTDLQAQTLTDFIVVDQFGYRPEARKTAVIRSPQEGSDKNHSFTPGNTYRLIDAATGETIHQAAPVLFDNGNTDAASGDKIWWFHFTHIATPGRYYVLDVEQNLRSFSFDVRPDVYNDVLKHAMRMFFYQRAGCEKKVIHAGAGWADGASHVGPLQDKNCRLYNAKNDAGTERDLHGGWYDAGDYNKYTAWAANYVEAMLLAYRENPDAFTDDYNIPESGNGIPDILDEARWGMDWLLRMQNEDGSSLSIVGMSHAYPPSAAKGQSLYGPANTIATITSAKAFALGAAVYRQMGDETYAATLEEAAKKAWQWATKNPDVYFTNSNYPGLGAGEQDSKDRHTRQENRCLAGIYLYELTADATYLTDFETNYNKFPLHEWYYYMGQYWHRQQLMLINYLNAPYAKESIKQNIKKYLTTAFNKAENYAGRVEKDGYRSFILDYNWGSNQYKAEYGQTFYLWATADVEPAKTADYYHVAEEYLHYIHGLNPLNMVYLTNMNNHGASRSLTEIYHSWFDHNSPDWDKVGTSTYGPAPGYLAGGANQSYTWDDCCKNNGCGSTANNALCKSEPIPVDEPPAKMYKDFNTSWPLNSWAITEPSNGYQVSYIRLLSKFVAPKGLTSTQPIGNDRSNAHGIITPNPVKRGQKLTLKLPAAQEPLRVVLYDAKGIVVSTTHGAVIDTTTLPEGVFIVKAYSADGQEVFTGKVQVVG